MSIIEKYSEYIAEQQRLLKIAGHIKESSGENSEITKKVIKKTGDEDVSHIGSTKEGHHVYAHSETDRGEASSYTVHHPDGKMTSHTVEHGGEPVSEKDLSKPADFHDVHKLHPAVRKIIHQDIKNETDY